MQCFICTCIFILLLYQIQMCSCLFILFYFVFGWRTDERMCGIDQFSPSDVYCRVLYCEKVQRFYRWKEGNVLFNYALNTFYLRLYGVGHMVKNHSD